MTTFAPTYALAAQRSAETLGVPRVGGVSVRFVGPHLYVSPRPASPGGSGRVDFEEVLSRRLRHFRRRWTRRVERLDRRFGELMAAPLDPDGLGRLLEACVQHEREAWRVHFEEMYVLLVGHLRYRAAAVALGVPAELADACLEGYPTQLGETDELLRQAAALSGSPRALQRAVEAVVAVRGDRTEGIADVALPSWREDPAPALARARLLVARDALAASDSMARRTRARAAALGAARDPGAFAALVEVAERANWQWWNEEHNAWIDLRASLPLRRAARAIGAQWLGSPDDAVLLAVEELAGLAAGGWTPSRGLREERRSWLAEWQSRRDALPARRGDFTSLPSDDPVLQEIFGLREEPWPSERSGELVGVGASGGRAAGRAVVLRHADDLGQLRPGDVLVCEATSPNWSAAFAIAAAVVCEHGGYTTHAAIAARSYGLPCVVGVDGATGAIRNGELIEVDGDAGRIRRGPASLR
jgi:pyruvate,water dikinase